MTVSRTHVAREAARRVRRSGVETGEQVRQMRLDGGVSLAELARVVDVHPSHIARIEAATTKPSVKILTAIGVALGADLSIRYFAGSGPRLRDRFQAAMVESLLRALDPRWSVELEVPVIHPSRGVIDVVLTDRLTSVTVAAEVQSQIRRLEQQLRWNAEKADGLAQRLVRDGHAPLDQPVSRLLILRSTVATRASARTYASTLSSNYPARAEDIARALTSSTTRWPGAGVLWMDVRGSEACLMRFPPRGVDLGR
ncbi:MAG TPA: helix-turn-helix transcriptional regulator [Candidatus Limnocylindrales bacterium]|nr:helix-turn-helix transcriptional regulator [Candidatus Limnocylindrales bacterium]